ncbi:MAG TPA: hypothetical protein VIH45_11865 [Desulfuromonadaceae bacterium]
MKAMLVKPIAMCGLAIMLLGMTACGNNGGSTSYFKTVTVAPVGTLPNTTSTVLASNNTSDTAVTVTLQSTAYAGITTPSPVTITRSTIHYAKDATFSPGTAPATLPDQDGPRGQILPGGTLALPFDTAAGIFKDNLVSSSGFVPGGPKWRYFVTYSFSATEDYTNTSASFTVPGGAITFQ